MENISKKGITQFWSHVDRKSDSECWNWTASKSSKGYGQFKINGKTIGAHVVSYFLLRGDYPKGLHLDHLCRNRACVNPTHLEPVTCKTNIQRGETGKHQRDKTHCPKGHEYTAENTIFYTNKSGKTSRYCRMCGRVYSKAAMARLRARKSA
jgi:hypothetical protein